MMNVICIEDEALFFLVEEVIKNMEKKDTSDWQWVDTEEAMNLLGIKSKTTLQKIRDNGLVRFSQPQKKVILYDKSSIAEYLDINAHETF